MKLLKTFLITIALIGIVIVGGLMLAHVIQNYLQFAGPLSGFILVWMVVYFKYPKTKLNVPNDGGSDE